MKSDLYFRYYLGIIATILLTGSFLFSYLVETQNLYFPQTKLALMIAQPMLLYLVVVTDGFREKTRRLQSNQKIITSYVVKVLIPQIKRLTERYTHIKQEKRMLTKKLALSSSQNEVLASMCESSAQNTKGKTKKPEDRTDAAYFKMFRTCFAPSEGSFKNKEMHSALREKYTKNRPFVDTNIIIYFEGDNFYKNNKKQALSTIDKTLARYRKQA